MKIVKQFGFDTLDIRPDGGRIRINTGAVDRDHERVLPGGARVDNYLKNPVVQWAHNYSEPWATIGRTNEIIVTPDAIDVDFTLRPAANETDPQAVINLLWAGKWINAASIGFLPDETKAVVNEFGRPDYTEWELLEWSLVPIPANQEALRQNMAKIFDGAEQKSGRVLSSANEKKIQQAASLLEDVLAQLKKPEPDDEKDVSEAVATTTIDDIASDALDAAEAEALLDYFKTLQEAYHG